MAALRNAQREVRELRKLEFNHQRAAHSLRERVKELNCLYTISALAEQRDLTPDGLVRAVIEVVPPAWQYPEVTCCRVCLEGKEWRSARFAESELRQSQSIVVAGAEVGLIEVLYSEERPPADEGPFLKEERSLLNVIATRIGDLVERRRAQQAIDETNSKNRALLEAIPDLMFQLDARGTLLGFHTGEFVAATAWLAPLVGTAIGQLFDDERLPVKALREGMQQVDRVLTSGEPGAFELQVELAARLHHFEIRLVPSGPQEVLGMLRDVTQRRQLERQILEISGREQQRIGRDLHDSLCQHLAGVGFLTKALSRRIPPELEALHADATEIAQLIDEAITLTRGFARGLNPVRLEADGLLSSLEELAEHTQKIFGVSCRFEHRGGPLHVDGNTALHLYRIVQESVQNAIKHGSPNRISISVGVHGARATLFVADDGTGFSKNAGQSGNGMGLSIMNYRALIIGGALEVCDRLERGTLVICRFPVVTPGQARSTT